MLPAYRYSTLKTTFVRGGELQFLVAKQAHNMIYWPMKFYGIYYIKADINILKNLLRVSEEIFQQRFVAKHRKTKIFVWPQEMVCHQLEGIRRDEFLFCSLSTYCRFRLIYKCFNSIPFRLSPKIYYTLVRNTVVLGVQKI